MNVGIFTNSYKPLISGVVNAIDHIKNGLEAKNHKVYIFAPAYRGYRDQNGNIFRFRSLNLLSDVDFPLAIPYSRRLKRFITPISLQLIHTQHPFLLGISGAKLAKRLNIPLVYTFHTQYEQYAHYVPLRINANLIRKITRKLIGDYANRCHCIITPSASICDLLKSYKIKTRIEVIPNAVDLTSFSSLKSKTAEKQKNDSAKLLLYVGRIAKEKNLTFMLDAFRKIADIFPLINLMFVGGGPWEKEFQDEIQKRGLLNRVSLTGFVPYNEIPEYMAKSDLLLMTSTSEVKPLALLEGMASGLPIVAVDAPGANDTITSGHDGLLTPNSVESYTQILAGIIKDNDLRQKLSLRAQETAKQYSVENITDKLLNVYRSLLPH